MANLFSIILPVHNGGSYLKECVESILAQTYKEFDLIILENKSTDGSFEWLQSLQDPRIKIIPSEKLLTIEENWGRIKDIKTNEFITLIGHDDVFYPNYLQEIDILIALHPEASIYQTHFIYIDATGDEIRKCLPMEETQDAAGFLACQFTRQLDSTGTGYMFRKKDYDALGGIDPAYSRLIFADFELWVKLISLNYKATSRENCFAYRIHMSASTTTNGQDYTAAFTRYIEFLSGLRINKEVSKTCDEYGKNFLLYFCESLSHRLLKTNKSKKNNLVNEFIQKCKSLAVKFIPGQEFNPGKKKEIWLAKYLDKNYTTRRAFQKINTLRKK